MGFDAKGIGFIIWKILGFSINTSCRFVRNHPISSSVFMFFFFLYIFVPSVFYFLIYSTPILACIAIFGWKRLASRHLEIQIPSRNEKDDKEKASSESKNVGANRNDRSYLRHQRSVRRNARRKIEEWDSQTSEDEKDKVILTTLYNDLLGRTPHFEESPKAIETDTDKNEVSRVNSSQKLENSANALSFDPSFRDLVSVGAAKLASGGGETEEEEEEEEGGKEDRKWLEENNQKNNNVMEPGISEIERNRRLESLIARRRARRLFKLALDQKNMMGAETVNPGQNLNMSLIVVPRNNGFDAQNNSSNVDGLQMPGSAPSVLLPARNPFDLPYDPQEEKPNLTGDSFDQEFSVINQKDMFFCRHESFCRGALFSPEPMQDTNKLASCSNSIEGKTSGMLFDTGNGDENRVEQELPQEGEEREKETNMVEDEKESVESGKSNKEEVKGNAPEVQMETDSNREYDSDSSSTGESEHEFNVLNRAELKEAICQTMGKIPGLLGGQVRNPLPSPLPRSMPPRFDDHHLFYASRGVNLHARTFSIASDLQVEVSEIGSPPTTVDGNDNSSNDGESYMYDTDIEREIAHYGEERWRKVSHHPESKPIKENEVSEETGKEVRFSGMEKNPVIPVSSATLTTEVAGKDMKDTSTSSISRVVVSEKIEGDETLIDSDGKTREHVKEVVEELSERPSLNSPDSFSPANQNKLEVADQDMNNTSTSSFSRVEEPQNIIDRDGENQEHVKQVVEELVGHKTLNSLVAFPEKIQESPAPPEKLVNEMREVEDKHFSGDILDKAAENINTESVEPTEKTKKEEKNQSFFEDIDGHPEKLTDHLKETKNACISIQGHHDTEVIQECKIKENDIESVVSEVSKDLNDSASLTQIVESLIEWEKMEDKHFCSKILAKPADSIKSESSEHTEQKMKEKEDSNIIERINRHPVKLIENEESGNDSNIVQMHQEAESVQECKKEENVDELVVSEDTQNLNDSTSLNQVTEPFIEQVSPSPGPSSSSSPRSVLLDNITPVDHMSSLNPEEWEHINVPQSDVEDTTRVHTLDYQPPHESEIAQHLGQTSVIHPSNDEDFGKSEEPSGLMEKSLEEQISTKTEAKHEKLEPNDDNTNSNLHETMEQKEMEPIDTFGESSEEANVVDSIKNLVIIEKGNDEEPKCFGGSEYQPKFSTRQEDLMEKSTSEEVTNSNFVEDAAGNFLNLTEGDNMGVALEEGSKNVVETSKQANTEDKSETTGDVQHESEILEDSLVINRSTTEVESDGTDTSETGLVHNLAINPKLIRVETDQTGTPEAHLEHNLAVEAPTRSEVEADLRGSPVTNLENNLDINPSKTEEETDRVGTLEADVEQDLAINPPTKAEVEADLKHNLAINPLTTSEVKTDHESRSEADLEHDLAINPSKIEEETDHMADTKRQDAR